MWDSAKKKQKPLIVSIVFVFT